MMTTDPDTIIRRRHLRDTVRSGTRYALTTAGIEFVTAERYTLTAAGLQAMERVDALCVECRALGCGPRNHQCGGCARSCWKDPRP